MQNRSPEKSQIPGEGVKTRKWRLAWENPGKRGTNIVSQPEASENEQPDPTRQLRETTGIPNDDRTEQKSPIGEDRVEKLALTGRE